MTMSLPHPLLGSFGNQLFNSLVKNRRVGALVTQKKMSTGPYSKINVAFRNYRFWFFNRMATANFHKVFVYGTLKQGEPNHGWFTKDEIGYFKFLFQARTVEKYPLIIATKYNIPFLLCNPGVGNHVKGEVYEVDDVVLKNLDMLEDHPNYYIREQCNVESLNTGDTEVVSTWMYFIKNYKEHLLNLPMYESYSNDGPHGLKYFDKYKRDERYDHKSEILKT